MKKRLKIINALLGLSLLGILYLAIGQLSAGSKPPMPDADSVAVVKNEEAPVQETQQWNQYAEAAQQNLFDKSRAPYTPPAPAPKPKPIPRAPAPAPVVPPPNVEVNGIVMAGGQAAAIVRWRQAPKGEKSNRILKSGDAIGDYTVSEIEMGYVIFDSQGERFKVEKTRGDANGGFSAPTAVQRLEPAPQPPIVEELGESRVPVNRPTLRETADQLNVPEGYEVYMTPMGPSIRKSSGGPAGAYKGGPKANDLFGHSSQ